MKIRDVCEIQTGLTVKSKLEVDPINGVNVVRLQDIGKSGNIRIKSLIKARVNDDSSRYKVEVGDVVFRSRGTWTTAAYVPNQLVSHAVAIMPVLILRPNPELITSRYLAWAINKPESQEHLRQRIRNSTIPMVPVSELANLKITLPDVDTQRKIAHIATLIEARNIYQRRLMKAQQNVDNWRLSLMAESSNQSN